jgi:hypothetical protein
MIYKEYLYSNGELFKIDENFETTRISDWWNVSHDEDTV